MALKTTTIPHYPLFLYIIGQFILIMLLPYSWALSSLFLLLILHYRYNLSAFFLFKTVRWPLLLWTIYVLIASIIPRYPFVSKVYLQTMLPLFLKNSIMIVWAGELFLLISARKMRLIVYSLTYRLIGPEKASALALHLALTRQLIDVVKRSAQNQQWALRARGLKKAGHLPVLNKILFNQLRQLFFYTEEKSLALVARGYRPDSLAEILPLYPRNILPFVGLFILQSGFMAFYHLIINLF